MVARCMEAVETEPYRGGPSGNGIAGNGAGQKGACAGNEHHDSPGDALHGEWADRLRTLQVSWPSFTTAGEQAVVAGNTTVAIGSDGFVSVNLTPNVGASPAGLYYTAVFYLSNGTTTTQYWVVPAAAQATLAQVQSQVMPAAQAVQAVSKAYVDQAIAEAGQSQLSASGETMTGPLYLNADPTQAMQAADKHYVDVSVSQSSTQPGTAGQIAYYTGTGTAIAGMNAVPVAAGGTGAGTAASALQNLGGISATATTQQTMTGGLSIAGL